MKYCPVLSFRLSVRTHNKLKCELNSTVHLLSLLQGCPESWGEPARAPEEDIQCSPAAQGPSDAGAGGGVKSSYSATCAMDFCAFYIPLLVVSGFCNIHFDGAQFKPKLKEESAFRCFLTNPTRQPEGVKKRIGLPSSHSRE